MARIWVQSDVVGGQYTLTLQAAIVRGNLRPSLIILSRMNAILDIIECQESVGESVRIIP